MTPYPDRAPSILALGLAFSLAACAGHVPAQDPVGAAAPRQGEPEQVVEAEVAWEGTVTALDVDSRLVSVRDAAGEERTLRIDEQVQRLETMQVGDRVQVYYRRALVFDMQPAGSAEPGAYIWEDQQHPDPARPGVVDREVVVVLAPLVAIDTEANTVSVRSPNGTVHVLDVEEQKHRDALPGLQPGDLLRIQFRRVLAVRVLPAN